MSSFELNPVSYVVLGLIARDGPSTPYELKVAVSKAIARLWPFPHSQLYAEPERLARAGLLQEKRETGGRRRRVYRLTEAGRRALRDWLADPTPDEPFQIRDLAILKLYFGHFARPEDMVALAQRQVDRFRLALDESKEIERRIVQHEGREYQLAVHRAGVEMWGLLADIWKRVAEDPPPQARPKRPR